MNLLFDSIIKNLHTLMLPSSLWGIHVDPKFQFVAALKMGLAGMERIFVEKAVLLAIDSDSLRVLIYLHNELIYLPGLDCGIESVSDYTKLLYSLHNEVDVCRKYIGGVSSPACQKFVLRSHNTDYCQICTQENYIESLNAENNSNNYDPHSLDDENVANSVHPSFDSINQSVVCTEIHQPVNDIDNTVIERLQSNSLICHECNVPFPTLKDLEKHESVHSTSKGYVCEICNHRSNEMVMHQRHLASHKPADSNLCNVCGKTFQKKHRLKDHMLIHMSEKPYKCTICRKAFSKEYNLKMHKRVHFGERPFICSKCGKTYTTSSNLSTHYMSAHETERRHHCDTCNMSFVHPRNLRIHMRKHTGEKPFECDTCAKGFAKKVHLTIHYRTHSGERPYVCEVCEKAFTTTGNLNSHRKIHHKDDLT